MFEIIHGKGIESVGNTVLVVNFFGSFKFIYKRFFGNVKVFVSYGNIIAVSSVSDVIRKGIIADFSFSYIVFLFCGINRRFWK